MDLQEPRGTIESTTKTICFQGLVHFKVKIASLVVQKQVQIKD